jgi:hypothetical protein
MVATPALLAGEFIALSLRRRLRLRRRRPARGLPERGHLAFQSVRPGRHPQAPVADAAAGSSRTGSSSCCWRPVALELLRQASRRTVSAHTGCSSSTRPGVAHGARRSSRRCSRWPHPSRSGTAPESSIVSPSRRSCCSPQRSRRSRARSIHTSCSTRSPRSARSSGPIPDTARMLIVKLSGLLRRLMRSQEHFVTLREELDAIDEYLDIETVRFGPRLRVVQGHRSGHARRHRAEHDPPAARRELRQTRARAQTGSRGRSPSAAGCRTDAPCSRLRTTAWGSCSTGSASRCRAASVWPTFESGSRSSTGRLPADPDERARQGDLCAHRRARARGRPRHRDLRRAHSPRDSRHERHPSRSGRRR